MKLYIFFCLVYKTLTEVLATLRACNAKNCQKNEKYSIGITEYGILFNDESPGFQTPCQKRYMIKNSMNYQNPHNSVFLTVGLIKHNYIDDSFSYYLEILEMSLKNVKLNFYKAYCGKNLFNRRGS
jgi:hypothetical protein